ncbi:MAG: DUF2147 domain-containing protein [Proteobacteria bacterium]|nr:DUF2147 domain-containing protein [Pseudomonadota bacterium]
MAAPKRCPRPKFAQRERLIAVALAAVYVAGFAPAAATNNDIFGTWLRDDGDARVRVTPCGYAICAINLWIRDPKKQGEKVGDRLEFRIKPDGKGWSGKAYDPQRKLTFSATLSAEGETMTTKGCMVAGLICRTTTWRRLPATTAAQ